MLKKCASALLIYIVLFFVAILGSACGSSNNETSVQTGNDETFVQTGNNMASVPAPAEPAAPDIPDINETTNAADQWLSEARQWRSLNELQDTGWWGGTGIVVKRNNYFLPLELFNTRQYYHVRFNTRERATARTPRGHQHPQDVAVYIGYEPFLLLPDDRLVIFGDLSYLFYNLTPQGRYTALVNSVPTTDIVMSPNILYFQPERGMSAFVQDWNRNERIYTYVNGYEIIDIYQNDNLFQQRFVYRNGIGIRLLLLGYLGQEFTLGRWLGTDWLESTVTINARIYEKSDWLDVSEERTMNGYFYLNFPRTSGIMMISQGWMGTVFLEIP